MNASPVRNYDILKCKARISNTSCENLMPQRTSFWTFHTEIHQSHEHSTYCYVSHMWYYDNWSNTTAWTVTAEVKLSYSSKVETWTYVWTSPKAHSMVHIKQFSRMSKISADSYVKVMLLNTDTCNGRSPRRLTLPLHQTWWSRAQGKCWYLYSIISQYNWHDYFQKPWLNTETK